MGFDRDAGNCGNSVQSCLAFVPFVTERLFAPPQATRYDHRFFFFFDTKVGLWVKVLVRVKGLGSSSSVSSIT